MNKLMSRKVWALALTQFLVAGLGWQFDVVVVSIICSTVATVCYIAAQAYVDAVGPDNTSVDEWLEKIDRAADGLPAWPPQGPGEDKPSW